MHLPYLGMEDSSVQGCGAGPGRPTWATLTWTEAKVGPPDHATSTFHAPRRSCLSIWQTRIHRLQDSAERAYANGEKDWRIGVEKR